MMLSGPQLGLAAEVLALDDAIQDVLVAENRAGELVVVDHAGRTGVSPLAVEGREDTIIVPSIILGAASQIGNIQETGELKLVAILYAKTGAVVIRINDDSYLIATSASNNLPQTMRAIELWLPSVNKSRSHSLERFAINSAIEADQAVRSFFEKSRISDPNTIQLEDATLNPTDHSWQVSGSYRPPHALRSKRYRIELNAISGDVTRFQAFA